MWLAVQPEGCITPPESDGNPVEQLRSADGRIAQVGSLGDGLPERAYHVDKVIREAAQCLGHHGDKVHTCRPACRQVRV